MTTLLNEIPTGRHYAIVTQKRITIPGDKRSREAPGHGYPEHDENFIVYESFTSREAWISKIKEYETTGYSKTNYRAFVVEPVGIKLTIGIETDEP